MNAVKHKAMVTEPLLEIYPKLNGVQQQYIRKVLWEVYGTPLLIFLAKEQQLSLPQDDKVVRQQGRDFVETGRDSNGLLLYATELAQKDNVNSIKELCLYILRIKLDSIDNVKHFLDEDDESITASTKGEIKTASDTMIMIFPELRPVIAEFGLEVQHEQQTEEFYRPDRRSGRESIH